ncbi:ergothioneine biosynthesis protein EgtB [Kangiella sp. TOML190]|uniref:ergothioneine biosynthesis protein EgtB n=1 Tax=Kangiella sp. TOML190 TaxID=2931351 RepID=UPI00203F5156|nr:ergothioneine biosynthesis protein EgtB [Kangiella sp. TOML190]
MNSKEIAPDFCYQSLISRFRKCRLQTEQLCQPLEVEDYGLQAVAETSPVKWHLAHTSWFFETFILEKYEANFTSFDKNFSYLFNSYYNGVGKPFLRSKRGLLSRPTVKAVFEYRRAISERIEKLFQGLADSSPKALYLLELGINHEQQHQELLLTDLLYNWYQNPLYPAYKKPALQEPIMANLNSNLSEPAKLEWVTQKGGLVTIGKADDGSFAFDNEYPRHQVFIKDFLVADRLVTNREYLAFIDDKGYQRPEFWLSDGWAKIQEKRWQAPLYWSQGQQGNWFHYGYYGLQPLDLASPVSNISAYEADAFARWAQSRLMTEAEWELIAAQQEVQGNFIESDALKPLAAGANQISANRGDLAVQQLYGDLWEWIASSYSPYPGFKAAAGAVGEYNGKFMCNQLVLRGGSCVTSCDHMRSSYRNFFYPEARWQFSGIRLAKDL